MKTTSQTDEIMELGGEETADSVELHFGMDRRSFVQVLGAGLVIALSCTPGLGQNRGGRGGFRGSGAKTVGARIHIGEDGQITLLTGKVEMGQGGRTELAQAAAEELHVPISQVQCLMGDTALVPDDGMN